MNDRERMQNPTPPAPEMIAPETVARAAGIVQAAQNANMRQIQAKATMWQCVSILVIVFSIGMIIPTLFFCFRLVEIIRVWSP